MRAGTGSKAFSPETYTVTFTLPGFATVRREGLIVSGSAVITVDAELRVGGVQETVTVTGETPIVDVQSTKREITIDNETMRSLPGPRSYSYLVGAVPGVLTNGNNINTGPVFLIFPIHGGRGVESRLTVDGLNISNPPGGNQPPNFTADISNSQEVTMTTSGGLGEMETAGLTMNIVPKQGGNRFSGIAYTSGFSKGMQSDNFTPELQARGATQPTPVYRVYDVNVGVGGPIVQDKLWYYFAVRAQGQRQDTLNVYYNKNAGNASAWTYDPDLAQPAFSDRTWENYTPRLTWQATAAQQVHGLLGRTAGLPQLLRHDLADRHAELHLSDLARGGRPRRVQPAARPDRALDVAGDQPAAARGRLRHHLLRVGRQGARPEPDAESGAGGESHADHPRRASSPRCGTARRAG